VPLTPRLLDVRIPDRPAGVVLVLHGGAGRRGNMMVSPAQLSVLRMIPIARRIGRAGRGQLAVLRLLNSHRGWDTRHTPVRDAQWATAQIAERLGQLPVCLVGHSLGGRAALLAAGHPRVRSVVALAPWVYATDAPPGPIDARILIVHGTADRIAGPARSLALARTLSERTDVSYISVLGGKHAMLKHHAWFDGLAADYASATLLGAHRTAEVGRIEAGERWLEV
jgi:pimeloyl-ACP methyl ester carboxylesterase